MLTNVFFPQPYLTPFPDAGTVFAEPAARYAKHLNPLASIDLSIVDPTWTGKIHMVGPNEPVDGCIGEGADAYHTDYLQHNWLGFRLNDRDRYELCGDFRFFLLERASEAEAYAVKEMEEFYVEQARDFSAARAHFLETGQLASIRNGQARQTGTQIAGLSQIGGGVGSHSSSYSHGIPVDKTNGDDVVPLTRDGERFRFIASVPSWNYGLSNGSVIFLFFEPKSRIALFSFHFD
jgi:hypothetical protein